MPTRRRRPTPWWVVALAVLAVAAMVLAVVACGSEGSDQRSGASTTAARVPDAGSSPGDPGTGSAPTSAGRTTAAPTTSMPARGPLGNGTAVTISFAGDVHYEGALAASLRTDPPSPTLDGVQPVLSAADLTVVNLETAITTGGRKVAKEFNFRAPPSAIAALLTQGVDVIGMANNHALDYGQSGLADTLAAVGAVGAPVIGVGRDEAQAYRPFVATVHGQRIGVIDASQVINGDLVASWTATADHPGLASAKRVDRLLAEVRATRPRVDTLVVFLHWGTETQQCPNAAQLELAPQLVDAGADVVVGSHAHRILGGGFLGHAYVDYGLGNFQFIGGRSAGSTESGILTVKVTGRRVDGAVWSPAHIDGGGRPHLLSGAAAQAAQGRKDGWRSCAKLTAAPTEEPPAT
jgi:poly-gamma-glutamate synthesis protein (capsule biosynthesis protein)